RRSHILSIARIRRSRLVQSARAGFVRSSTGTTRSVTMHPPRRRLVAHALHARHALLRLLVDRVQRLAGGVLVRPEVGRGSPVLTKDLDPGHGLSPAGGVIRTARGHSKGN